MAYNRLINRFWQLLLAAMISLGAESVCAQTFLYDVDFVMDFDNRESYNPYEASGTIFGVRLTPTIGVAFDDSIGGQHRLMAGVSYIQPFGSRWRDCTVTPTVYYQYDSHGFRLNFGFLPYDYLFCSLPDYLRSDSLAFAYPNIQGALLQYRSKWGYIEMLCDWRGMMTPETREAFRIAGGGKFCYQWFYAGGFAQMNHLSHSTLVKGVCDDVVLNPLVGVNLASLTPLDSLSLQAGYIMGWQRDRKANVSELAHGFHADIALRWRFVGFRNELYIGQNQMPLYPAYGSILNQGDPHYQARIYNRTDLYLYLIRRSFVTAYAGWNLIYVQGYGLSHQQQLVCRFNLGETLRYAHLSKNQRLESKRRGDLLRTLSYR